MPDSRPPINNDPDIQSELHQTKRRFTDFVFQRVRLGGGDGSEDAPRPADSTPSPISAAQRTFRSPRAVSSFNFPPSRTRPQAGVGAGDGVPLVRATSPGAEFREEHRRAMAKREGEEKMKRAVQGSPASISQNDSTAGPASGRSSALSGRESQTSTGSVVRKFQISRSSTPSSLRKSLGSGVQKRKGDGSSSPGVAVLVEKLRRKPLSRKASMVSDLLATDGAASDRSRSPLVPPKEVSVPTPARKRPVVNQAEKRWREEQQNAISSAKQHIAQIGSKDSDDEADRLAKQLEQIALELDGGVDETPTEVKEVPSDVPKTAVSKPPLKYRPRPPNRRRQNAAEQAREGRERMQDQPTTHDAEMEEDAHGDFVFDTYIRQPLPDSGFTNPLTDMQTNEDAFFRQHGIDTTRQDVGVIVITQEDEEYWMNFAEDDEADDWDSEDADSNGTPPNQILETC